MPEEATPWSDVAPQVMFAMDAKGVCTMSVGRGLAALGYRDHELVGTDLLELFRDDPEVVAHLRRALRGETFAASTDRAGRAMWVYYQPLCDAGGRFTGSLAVSIDVTDRVTDVLQVASARHRAETLARLAVTLGREARSPQAVLDIGLRIATQALGDVGVVWLLSDDADRVQARASWHADPDARRRVEEALAGEPEGGWTSGASIRDLTEPTLLDGGGQVAQSWWLGGLGPVADELGLAHGLRMPVRSRGTTVGAVDFFRDRRRGPFGRDEVALADEIAGRFTLAYDNALLLVEQRADLQALAKFRALAEASDDLIAMADVEGVVTYLNPRLRASGYLGRGSSLWQGLAEHVDPTTVRTMRRHVEDGERWRGEVSLRDGGSSELLAYVATFHLAVPDSDERSGVAWIAQDVTTLRETEVRLRAANAELRRFQALVEASNDFIAIAGLDGRVLYVNPAGRALVGLGPDEDVRSTTIADYLTPEGLAQSQAVEQPAVRDRGSWEGESTLKGAEGRPVPVAISSFLIRDLHTGEAIGMATVQRDITERHRAARKVQRLAEHRRALLQRLVQAQEVERAEIAAEVHDDSVQALAAVDLRLGLLSRSLAVEAPQLLPSLEPLQETVSVAIDRLRALLFDLESPDFDDGLGQALGRAADEILGPGVARVVAADEPATGDDVRTVAYRIATEALINVRKHAEAKRVTISVGRRRDGLLVEVADDGVGLGGEAPQPSLGHHGVTGMRDRASVAGGTVRFSDRPGGGAVVSIWLPGQAGEGPG